MYLRRSVVIGAVAVGAGLSGVTALPSPAGARPAAKRCTPSATLLELHRIPSRDLAFVDQHQVEVDNPTSVPLTVTKTMQVSGTKPWTSSKPAASLRVWQAAVHSMFAIQVLGTVTVSQPASFTVTVPPEQTALLISGVSSIGMAARQRVTSADCRLHTTAMSDTYFPTRQVVIWAQLRRDGASQAAADPVTGPTDQ